MQFQLLGDWPCGQWLVPAGTILDGADPRWNGIALPYAMPLNVLCLDQSAYDAMVAFYGIECNHLLYSAPGIKRMEPRR
jgi:hypothetical protein